MNTKNFSDTPMELAPEQLAFEAALSTAKIQCDPALKEKTKAKAMLEFCRTNSTEPPNLIETILNAGEQHITLSLRQYVKLERFRAAAVGTVIGLILGTILNVLGTFFLFLLLRSVS